VGTIDTFLRELSAVEDAQAEALCQRIDVLDRDHVRLGMSGRGCTLQLPADRRDITNALRAVATAGDPAPGPLVADAECRARHRRWVQLLDDLGLYGPDLASLSRARPPGQVPWRYQRIDRSGPSATITVTNGCETLTHAADLDASDPPTAVPIEIAADILAQPQPRSAGAPFWMAHLLHRARPRTKGPSGA
jgi:hypothetical protein